jgi:hypothetical protein
MVQSITHQDFEKWAWQLKMGDGPPLIWTYGKGKFDHNPADFLDALFSDKPNDYAIL